MPKRCSRTIAPRRGRVMRRAEACGGIELRLPARVLREAAATAPGARCRRGMSDWLPSLCLVLRVSCCHVVVDPDFGGTPYDSPCARDREARSPPDIMPNKSNERM